MLELSEYEYGIIYDWVIDQVHSIGLINAIGFIVILSPLPIKAQLTTGPFAYRNLSHLQWPEVGKVGEKGWAPMGMSDVLMIGSCRMQGATIEGHRL